MDEDGPTSAEVAAMQRRLAELEAAAAERRGLQEDLRRSEERFEKLSTTTFEAILIHDQGVCLDCNQAFAEMLGYNRDEVIGSDPLTYVAPESSERVKANIASGYEESYEVAGLRKDGSTFAAELRGRAVPYGDSVARMVAIRDISERKEVEREHGRRLMLAHVHRAILEMEQVEDFARVVELFAGELRALGVEFDGLGVNIIDEASTTLLSYAVLSGERASVAANPFDHPTIRELLEYWRRQEVWERIPDEKFAETVEKYGDVNYRPGVVVDVPFVQGTVAISRQGMLGENDELVEILQACAPLLSLGYSRSRDLDQRRQAEEALQGAHDQLAERVAELEAAEANRRALQDDLRRSEERFEKLSTTTFEAILIHDKGVCLDCNQTFASMFGYTRGEVIGSDPLSYGTPESRPLMIANIASGYEEPYEAVGRRKDGSTFAAELRGRAVPYGDSVARMVAIHDISERKEVEREHGRRLLLAIVHRAILEMEQVEDYIQVVELFARELRALGTEFDGLGVNIIDEAADILISYTAYFGGKAERVVNPLQHPTNQELIRYWRRQEVWERAPDEDFKQASRDYGEPNYKPGVVIDAPFDQGTLVVGRQGQVGENAELIEMLQACCSLLSLGYSRSRDLDQRRQAEEALQQAHDQLEGRVAERTSDLEREVADRVAAEEALKTSLGEKELLLKEIHHRVKNNMQVVSSLLDLQASQLSDPVTLDMFREGQNRVRTMALVHEKLYQTDNLARIDMADYIAELATDLLESYEREANSVGLDIAVAEVELDVDLAVPCGLILNELISNAFKHGFPDGRQGIVGIALSEAADAAGELVLRVTDDGVGLPADLDLKRAQSLGLQLVHTLVAQIKGRLDSSREGGTAFEIRFPGSSA